MIEKLKISFINEVEKRFKNPFLGSFVISWVFLNWKFLYIMIFLDEKYVSVIPTVSNVFTTKFEYIINQDFVNVYNFVLFPLLTAFFIIVFIELVTTFLNIRIKKCKYWIEKRDVLTKEESQKIKEEQVNYRNNYIETIGLKNEQIISLENKNKELELRIEDKVNERLDVHQEKNLERIEELKKNLEKSESLSKERLDKNKILEESLELSIEELNILKVDVKGWKMKVRDLKEKVFGIEKENKELKKSIERLDKPLDKKYELEYEEFKVIHFFKKFGGFIDDVENYPYRIRESYSGKDIKYLKLKGIIEEFEGGNGNMKIVFTNKGDKFAEFFLDEYKGDISVEDIPF